MPFTLSHAAAALPFRKLKPIWPALVIGTFAPDLQYFIWVADEDHSGHHFPDVVLFTLPLALLVLWVFEWTVKGPVIELLPSGMQRRLQDKVEPLSFWGWGRLASIVLWIAVGIATHVLWDAFTHRDTWLTARWGMLRTGITIPFIKTLTVVGFLQHFSTVVGILALAAWVAAWYRRTSPGTRGELRELSSVVKVTVVFTVAVIALLVGCAFAIQTLSPHPRPMSRLYFAATVFEAVTLVFCVEWLLYGLARTVSSRFRRDPVPQLDEKSS